MSKFDFVATFIAAVIFVVLFIFIQHEFSKVNEDRIKSYELCLDSCEKLDFKCYEDCENRHAVNTED